MRKYLFDFIKKEDGIETIEFLALLAIAGILLGIVANVARNLHGTGLNLEGKISSGYDQLNNLK